MLSSQGSAQAAERSRSVQYAPAKQGATSRRTPILVGAETDVIVIVCRDVRCPVDRGYGRNGDRRGSRTDQTATRDSIGGPGRAGLPPLRFAPIGTEFGDLLLKLSVLGL